MKHKKWEGSVSENRKLTYQYNSASCAVFTSTLG